MQKLREKQGLSQDDIAKKLGITRVTVSKIENGQSEINTPLYLKLREIFQNEDIFRLADAEKEILESQGFTVYNTYDDIPEQLKPKNNSDTAIKYIAGATALAAVLMLFRK